MKTLLIPTDFKLESLDSIPKLVQRFYPQKLNILLVHTMGLSDQVGELLMLSRRSAEYRHISDAFYKSCTELKKKYSDNINEIRIEFFYGNTVAVFKNYLRDNDVDTIIHLENYNYQLLTDKSFDPTVLISRSGRRFLPIDVKNMVATTGKAPETQLAELEV